MAIKTEDRLLYGDNRPATDISDPKGENIEEKLYKDSDYYRRNELPVDRGWAWAICFSGFLISYNIAFSARNMAIQFLEVIDLFGTSLTTGSLIFLFYILGSGLMSIVSVNVIVPHFGEKRVVCTTGVLFCLCSVGYYLAPNIEVFLVCAAIKGLAMGASFVPSISLLRHYFHRRRSIAQSLARAGGSLAAMTVPPLIRFLRKEYGVRGAFLIGAGIELHIVLGGLLLRPVGSYKFKPDLPPLPSQNKRKKKVKSSSKDKSESEDIEMTLINRQASDQSIPSPEESTSVTIVGGNTTQASHDTQAHFFEEKKKDSSRDSVKRDKVIEPGVNENEAQMSEAEDRETLLMPQARLNSNHAKNSESNIKNRGVEDSPRRSRTMTMSSVGVPDESTVAVDYLEDDDEKETSGCGRYKFFQLWSFRVLFLFSIFGSGNLFIRNFVPTIAVSQGVTLDEAAMLVTVFGAVDFISRLGLGFVADTHILTPPQIVAVSHIVMGVVCHLTRFFNTFSTLVVMIVIIGMSIGARISMVPLVVMDIVGVEVMPQAYSIINTIGTVTSAAMSPSLSAVAESFGDFVPSLHILGMFFFTSAAICLSLPFFKRIDKRTGRS